ncbi:hypothetical protein [[Haemophilus] ducreyi]|uniref:hypothetical protein n=1 Tax=Haemophilus ducreyi TaxID=730 RepID=UPI0021C287DD|nr:hypothetical protein [[Haemophilus] ducreyi]
MQTVQPLHLHGRIAIEIFKPTSLFHILKTVLEESLWHGQQVTEAIAKGVSEIRFKVNVIGAISNNAIAFKDIVLRVGG